MRTSLVTILKKLLGNVYLAVESKYMADTMSIDLKTVDPNTVLVPLDNPKRLGSMIFDRILIHAKPESVTYGKNDSGDYLLCVLGEARKGGRTYSFGAIEARDKAGFNWIIKNPIFAGSYEFALDRVTCCSPSNSVRMGKFGSGLGLYRGKQANGPDAIEVYIK
jgi:hypothetical protein